MRRPDLGLAFSPLAPIDPPPSRAPGSRPPGVPRRIPLPRPRARPIATVVLEPRVALDIDDFQELRRQGLFGDDGRNPPPSWWAR